MAADADSADLDAVCPATVAAVRVTDAGWLTVVDAEADTAWLATLVWLFTVVALDCGLVVAAAEWLTAALADKVTTLLLDSVASVCRLTAGSSTLAAAA